MFKQVILMVLILDLVAFSVGVGVTACKFEISQPGLQAVFLLLVLVNVIGLICVTEDYNN